MSEVIKVIGKYAYAQVFESTRGMRIGVRTHSLLKKKKLGISNLLLRLEIR